MITLSSCRRSHQSDVAVVVHHDHSVHLPSAERPEDVRPEPKHQLHRRHGTRVANQITPSRASVAMSRIRDHLDYDLIHIPDIDYDHLHIPDIDYDHLHIPDIDYDHLHIPDIDYDHLHIPDIEYDLPRILVFQCIMTFKNTALLIGHNLWCVFTSHTRF